MRGAISLLAVIGCLTAAPASYPLESLRVSGNQRIPAGRIIAASGLRIGANADKSDFDAARDRLSATGAFENVGYEYKPSAAGTGYDAVLEVIEVRQLFPYRFEDLPASEEKLREALRKQEPIFEDRIPASDAVLGRYIKVIQQVIGPDIPLTARVSTELPGEAAILFRPSAERPIIAEVRFTGNQALPSTVLTRTLNAVAVGVPYSDAGFRQILEASLRPLYEAKGYVRVAFPNAATEKAAKVDGLLVTVAIEEGAAYKLGAIRLAGVPSAQVAELEKAASWKKEEIVNFDDVQAGLDRICQRYRNNGYLKVSGHVDRDVHDTEHTVDLTVAIDPGPQYTFGKLTISGLDILSEPEIRKIWRLDAGKPFAADYPDAFLARVRNEDLFDNLGKTRAETQVNDTTRTVDVTLVFSGAGAEEKENRQRRRR